jgi:hypothetical protein
MDSEMFEKVIQTYGYYQNQIPNPTLDARDHSDSLSGHVSMMD